MIKLSNGVEISEDTVVAALKKSGINVEPKPSRLPMVCLYGTIEGNDDDIYLEASQRSNNVKITSVTKNGSWRKDICELNAKGLYLFTCAGNAGFPTESSGKIRLI